MANIDLFGNDIIEDVLLRDKFIEPPFSILDTKSGNWQKRKRTWIAKGLKSEVGRAVQYKYGFNPDEMQSGKKEEDRVSVFDPALCEVLYHWFCP